MSELSFLKDLPSYNEKNFMYFNSDYGVRTYSKKPPIYISTKDFPSDQIIVNENKIVTLPYIREQWDKKFSTSRKRGAGENAEEGDSRKKSQYTNCSLV